MSNIEWGPPIKVATKGVRPDFVGEDDMVQYAGCRGMRASKWAWDGSHEGDYRLLATHPHYTKADDWKPDERTVTFLIEKAEMRAQSPCSATGIINELRIWLPKPDPAKALVEEWLGEKDGWSFTAAETFARWLIETKGMKL
jgi:hypothetical protein